MELKTPDGIAVWGFQLRLANPPDAVD